MTTDKRYCITGTCRHAYCRGRRQGQDRGVVQGIGYALAEAQRIHDNPVILWDVCVAAGLTYADFVRHDVDPFDLKDLRGHVPKPKRARKKASVPK